MWFFMSTEAATFLGIAIIAFFVIAGTKNAISYLAEDRSSTLIRIHPRNMKSPAGEAKLRYAFYYKPKNKFVAEVVCEKIKDHEVIIKKTMSGMEKKIDKVFADFDRRAAEC